LYTKKKEGTIVSIIERAGRESATDITMQLNHTGQGTTSLAISYQIVSIVRLLHVARVLRVRDDEVTF
jgi:hypothetical protein